MDRVLLIFDDIQYAGHLEMTLRKVGFDTETITNEYNLSEKLLTFNPDYIITKGSSTRVSGMQIGKKLKDTVKYSGKVILIFPSDLKPKPDELIKLRMDLLLFEPISVLRLVGHLLTLTTVNRDAVMDKLLRLAHTDNQFRQNEQQIIRNTGSSIDSEIQMITSNMRGKVASEESIDENSIQSFFDPNFKETKPTAAEDQVGDGTKAPATDYEKSDLDSSLNKPVDPKFIASLQEELAAASSELPLRVETYNHAINTIDQDLKKGLNKRKTKKSALDSSSVTSGDEKKDRDDERRNFVTALWKKDKGE